MNLHGLTGGHWDALLLLLLTPPKIDAIAFLTKSITGPKSNGAGHDEPVHGGV